VKWYTALKPKPKRPMAAALASLEFEPIEQMFRKSAAVNCASL
jgi:hypothetical protein